MGGIGLTILKYRELARVVRDQPSLVSTTDAARNEMLARQLEPRSVGLNSGYKPLAYVARYYPSLVSTSDAEGNAELNKAFRGIVPESAVGVEDLEKVLEIRGVVS